MLNLSAVIAWHVSAMTAERVFEQDPNALPSGYLKLPWCRITLTWSGWYRVALSKIRIRDISYGGLMTSYQA